MLKALSRALVAEKGANVADAWLRSIRMVRSDLDDETRTVPLPTLHRALVAFAEVASRDAILRAWKYLVAPDVLGVWVRVLRGTTGPAEAFARLDAADSQYGRTTRWETTAARRDWWRGRVSIAHDPALESDGLLGLARLAELAAVPALFGYSNAAPRAHRRALAARRGARSGVRGELAGARRAHVRLGLGALAGASLGAVPLGLHVVAMDLGVVVAAVSGVTGALAGIVRARDRIRHAESEAQQLARPARSSEASRSRSRTKAAPAGSSRARSRPDSTASSGAWARAPRASSTRRRGSPTGCPSPSSCSAPRRRTRRSRAIACAARPRRWVSPWHPNVVEVIDHGHLPDGTAYLVMELLRGESLAARVQTKGRLTPRELLPIAMQMCDALSAVHAAGVVHRDLKPSNIFLAVDPDDPAAPERVKLLDFGIARVEWEETRITNTGGPLGTPGYMSPEQEAGATDVDARSDLFALGAMLFECLVGEPPPPRTPSGLMRMRTPVGSALRLDSGTQKAAIAVPPAWRTVIERAMAVDPASRFADARSFAQSLRALADGVVEAHGNGSS